MRNSTRRLHWLLLAAALCTHGCMGPSLFKKSQKLKRSSAHDPATEMICLWQPARGPGVNHVPTRGCAGRIMFFTRGHASPVIVDGDVRVYLFHNLGTQAEQARPIHQFDFRSEDWHTFLENGPLGPAYNVFIPYTQPGQDQVECTVQVRLTPKEGPALYSEMTAITLPGKIDPLEAGFLPSKTNRSIGSAPATRNQPAGAELAVHSILKNNQVVPVNHEQAVPSPATPSTESAAAPSAHSPRDDRLDRLEQMMQQLLDQRSSSAPSVRDEAVLPPQNESAHPLSAQVEAGEFHSQVPVRRFRLSATAGTMQPANPPANRPLNQTGNPLVNHPLSRPVKRHPLQPDAEVASILPPSEGESAHVVVVEVKAPAHPLLEIEEPPRAADSSPPVSTLEIGREPPANFTPYRAEPTGVAAVCDLCETGQAEGWDDLPVDAAAPGRNDAPDE